MTERDMLPVIIGAGQDSRPVPDDLDTAFGPVDLAATALVRAFEDAGVTPQSVDRAYAVRLFGDSGPTFPNPFGGADNFPGAVCSRAGISADRYIYDFVGGQSPQTLMAEAAQSLMDGEAQLIAIVGAEAIANIKAAGRAGAKPDWTEETGLPLDDRGITPPGPMMVHAQALSHMMLAPVTYYALMETARRARQEQSKSDHEAEMGQLWEQFAAVAGNNIHATIRHKPSSADIVAPTDRNPIITTPYTKSMVARDGVNLGAAILLTTYGAAKAMGVSDDRMTFLHAHDQATEPPLLTRASLDRAEAMERVLESTGREADFYDIYSCFPIVPLEARRILGMSTDQSLTLTGGLPFFGGPGNNYALHGLAEMHAVLRGTDKVGVVYANGGLASKHAVGRYGGRPPAQVHIRKSDDPAPSVAATMNPDPDGVIRTYTVEYKRGEVKRVVVLAETEEGDRFYAQGDAEVAQRFIRDDPIGARITTSTKMGMNRVVTVGSRESH